MTQYYMSRLTELRWAASQCLCCCCSKPIRSINSISAEESSKIVEEDAVYLQQGNSGFFNWLLSCCCCVTRQRQGWFCSELVTAALHRGGMLQLTVDSPNHLYTELSYIPGFTSFENLPEWKHIRIKTSQENKSTESQGTEMQDMSTAHTSEKQSLLYSSAVVLPKRSRV